MASRLILYTAFAALVAILVISRKIAYVVVEAYGPVPAAIAILFFYALARLIHHRERGY